MIFIGGIHGVGKSFFCDKVKSELSILTYSSSELIAERKMVYFSSDKLIPDIDDNQQHLLSAINELNSLGIQYLLDGHFCLLNAEGQVTRIPEGTFYDLHPDAIILLTEKPEVIAERRKQRDGLNYKLDDIGKFQDNEIAYATEIANILGIPIRVSLGTNDQNKALDFIRVNMGRQNDGR